MFFQHDLMSVVRQTRVTGGFKQARGVVLKDNKIVNGWKTHIRGDLTCNYFMAGRRFMQLARGTTRGTTRGSNSHSVIERSSYHGNICRGG